MSARPWERTSAAKAAWVFVVVFGAWLAFIFVPAPRPDSSPPASASVSSLGRHGLPANPDLDSLPGVFAVWADHAQWDHDRTSFAFWNPGAHRYSYFFEAVRSGRTVRFHEIARPDELDERFDMTEPDSEEHPLMLIRSPTVTTDAEIESHARKDSRRDSTLPHTAIDVPLIKIEPAPPVTTPSGDFHK